MIHDDLPHSYVWPADYAWTKPQHHHHAAAGVSADVSTVKQVNYPVSSTEILVPWLLSMWMMGNKTPTVHPSKPKSAVVRKFHKNYLHEHAALKDRFTWGQIDIEYPDREAKRNARKTGKFIPINNLPLGLEIWKNKMFISLPQWRPGIPVTLTYVNLNGYVKSPVLKPYPSWSWYTKRNRCDGLVSVFRMEVDKCDRLWVLDTGAINLANAVDQICPVKLDVFDLNTDRLVKRFVIPTNQTSKDSLFSNIVVETVNDNCEDAYAYLSDVFQYGLIVYSYKEDTSRRINHPYFYPDPLYCHYSIDGIEFNWMDGIFGMCLSPPLDPHDRVLYFHSMSSNNEFYVPTASLRNSTLRYGDLVGHFVALNDSRCTRHQSCQSSSMAMDTKGVMYYNLVTKGQVGCWNSDREFGPGTQGILSSGTASVSFPNDLKVDKEPAQRIWMLSNALHKYLYGKLNPAEINFRIMTAYTDDIIKGTVCEQL